MRKLFRFLWFWIVGIPFYDERIHDVRAAWAVAEFMEFMQPLE